MNPISEKIKSELKKFLETQNVSRYAFSKTAELPESTVKRFLEDKIKNPSSELLTKVAAALEGDIVFRSFATKKSQKHPEKPSKN